MTFGYSALMAVVLAFAVSGCNFKADKKSGSNDSQTQATKTAKDSDSLPIPPPATTSGDNSKPKEPQKPPTSLPPTTTTTTTTSTTTTTTSTTTTTTTVPVQKPPVTPIEVTKEACIKSACPSHSNFNHPFSNQPDLQAKTLALIEAKLKKPLQNYIGRVIHQSLVKDQLFKVIADHKNQVQIKPNVAALMQTLLYASRIGKYTPALEFSATGELEFNVQKLKSDYGLSDSEAEAIHKLSALMRFETYYGSIFTRPMEMMLLYWRSDLSVEDAAQSQARDVLEAMDRIYQIVPSIRDINPRPLVIEKALNKVQLSEIEKVRFSSEVHTKYVLNLMVNTPILEAFGKIPFNQAALLEEIQKKYLKTKMAKAVAHPQSFKGLLQQTVKTCTEKLAVAYASRPTAQQLDYFKKAANYVVSQSQAMIEEKMKSSLAEPLNVKFIYPASQEESLSAWEEMLHSLTANLEKSIKQAKKFQTAAPDIQSDLWASFATQSEDEEPFAEILRFCDQAESPFLSDAALATINMVNVSWTSVRNPIPGIGVVAHEVGHIIQPKFQKLFEKEESCLETKQGSKQYLTEDFADLFSSEILKRLGSKWDSKPLANFACGLVTFDEKPSLKNPNDKDTHSSNLYRVLAIAAGTKSMTPQCTGFLKTENEDRFENYCQWEK